MLVYLRLRNNKILTRLNTTLQKGVKGLRGTEVKGTEP